ncbi:MAG: anti-sigma factor antagonist [Myxococcales bacterium]|nr:MAG: anti-sigma factor antagonist [Myxococcales bacterium]
MDISVNGDVMHVAGQVDGRRTSELRAELQELVGSTSGDLVLDLEEVESIDLTALRVIAVVSRDLGESFRHLRLRNASPLVRRLLHLSHLRGLVHFDEAV